MQAGRVMFCFPAPDLKLKRRIWPHFLLSTAPKHVLFFWELGVALEAPAATALLYFGFIIVSRERALSHCLRVTLWANAKEGRAVQLNIEGLTDSASKLVSGVVCTCGPTLALMQGPKNQTC